MILDGTKIMFYEERVREWAEGKRIAPITIDMSLTTHCNMKCIYCYGQLQKNKEFRIKKKDIQHLVTDCRNIGVKGISLVSDGESTLHPDFEWVVHHIKERGLDVACGTNGYLLYRMDMEALLRSLTYLRINISASNSRDYKRVMGAKDGMFEQVISNINKLVWIKKEKTLPCTIGMQMVLLPEFAGSIIPLAQLAVNLGVDYLIIKHCSDDEDGSLGVNYNEYHLLTARLKEAEAMSTERTKIVVKWSKIMECKGDKPERCYKVCLGSPFLLQISGTGLVAPCGMLFNDKYADFHIGNITQMRFKQLWESERYWKIMKKLGSAGFNAKTMCGSLCLQHSVNKWLHEYKYTTVANKERMFPPQGGGLPEHISFV